jgi:hypothetical protein
MTAQSQSKPPIYPAYTPLILARTWRGGRTGKDWERGGPLPHPQNFSKTFPVATKQQNLIEYL